MRSEAHCGEEVVGLMGLYVDTNVSEELTASIWRADIGPVCNSLLLNYSYALHLLV